MTLVLVAVVCWEARRRSGTVLQVETEVEVDEATAAEEMEEMVAGVVPPASRAAMPRRWKGVHVAG